MALVALLGRAATLGDGHVDGFGIDRRIVRHMGRVGEQQAQRVLAERQRDLRFGLAGAEMQVVEVVGDRLAIGGSSASAVRCSTATMRYCALFALPFERPPVIEIDVAEQPACGRRPGQHAENGGIGDLDRQPGKWNGP